MKRDSYQPLSLLLGSSSAGLLEITFFHPFDTAAKRLMVSRYQSESFWTRIGFQRGGLQSMYQGAGYAMIYKLFQRSYKFGCQPLIKDKLQNKYGTSWEHKYGGPKSQIYLNTISGMMIGMGEIVFLPFDVLKIKKQTDPNSLAGRGALSLFKTEKLKLYRGTTLTLMRNIPGSMALFAGNSIGREYIYHGRNSLSLWETLMCSTIGCLGSICAAAPFDVIKTRIQQFAFEEKIPARRLALDLVKTEGPGAFFKGMLPKTLVVGPKLIFSFTIAQYLFGKYESLLYPSDCRDGSCDVSSTFTLSPPSDKTI